jgi:hypothetical protein
LEERLGDHGLVYHAIHVQQRRSVAVKLLDPLPAPNHQAVQEFARELLFLQTLQHPNVVACYGGGVQDLHPYLAMELVRGESLDMRLRREGPLAWPVAMAIARQVCEALAYADHRNLLHLRLSPSKVLLGDDGVMRGIVKVADFRRPRGVIGVGEIDPVEQLAELAYQAPEQICGKPPVAPPTDVYALGCVLFEMLVGRPPFTGRTAYELKQLHLTADPPRVQLLVPDCPVWLDALVARLLEKDPQQRPQFASAVAVALDETQHKVVSGASVAEHVLSGAPSAIRPKHADPEARQLLPARKKAGPKGPFYERLWFLGSCLALLVLIVAWVVWPASDAQLLAKAEELMAGEDRDAWQVARKEYIEPLLSREPEAAIAERAQSFLDRIEIDEAEQRLQRRARNPSLAEKLYLDAHRYEDFGDPATALGLYEKLIEALEESHGDPPLLKLTRRRARAIRERGSPLPATRDVLDQKLKAAEDRVAEGDAPGAREIWFRIRTLYQGRDDVLTQRKAAEERLLGLDKPAEGP